MTTSEELGVTVENFASRLKRQLKEQEAAQSESARITQQRQAVLLKAMTGVRKALQDAARIHLGGRFSFDLEISDWEGWPKLELRLIDSQVPGEYKQSLLATAHDRNQSGTLQLALMGGEILATVHLTEEGELSRLPLMLKKSLRSFLDLVSQLILTPSESMESEGAQPLVLEAGEEDSVAQELLQEDLFSEQSYAGDTNQVDIMDSAPTLLLESKKNL